MGAKFSPDIRYTTLRCILTSNLQDPALKARVVLTLLSISSRSSFSEPCIGAVILLMTGTSVVCGGCTFTVLYSVVICWNIT